MQTILIHGAWHGQWVWSSWMTPLRVAGLQPTRVQLWKHTEKPSLDSMADHISYLHSHMADSLLIGHSMGALVGAKLIQRGFGRGLVMLTPPPIINKRDLVAAVWRDPKLLQVVADIKHPSILASRMTSHERWQKVLKGQLHPEDRRLMIEVVRFKHQPLDKPVIIIGAEGDQMVSVSQIEDVAYRVYRTVPQFVKGGHDLMYEPGMSAIPLIAEFAKGLPPITARKED